MRIVTLDRVYRWTERNACVFPSLPACSGSGPIQFVTVFVIGNRVFRGFACRGEANLLILLAAPQGFEPRYADPESAVLPLNEGAVSAGVLGLRFTFARRGAAQAKRIAQLVHHTGIPNQGQSAAPVHNAVQSIVRTGC